jgi:hypothetical protein
MDQLETPVALIVFNRPEVTRRVFRAIAVVRPRRLLIVADGPRADREGEALRCEEVRKIVSAVDWQCKVETNFSERNMGCRQRMVSGLDWVFSVVEEAIILEDDCVPDRSFFSFCAELLDRYRNSEQIGIISGHNPIPEIVPSHHSYFFTKMVSVWGWATWRRTWQKYDEHMSTWPSKKDDVLKRIWPNQRERLYWTSVFESMYQGVGPNTWDYQLLFKSWEQHWLNIIPSRNLIQNIGFGVDATHTRKENSAMALPAEKLRFPLVHPANVVEWTDHPGLLQRTIYDPELLRRVHRAVRSRMRQFLSGTRNTFGR